MDESYVDDIRSTLEKKHAQDNHYPTVTSNLQAILQLQNRLEPYTKHDKNLTDLYGLMNKYKQKLQSFSPVVSVAEQNISNSTSSKKSEDLEIDDFLVNQSTFEQLEKHTEILIQSKNVDPFWQIQKYQNEYKPLYGPVYGSMCGSFVGSFSFLKNLVMPTNTLLKIKGGIGAAVAGVAYYTSRFKNASTVININVPTITSTNLPVENLISVPTGVASNIPVNFLDQNTNSFHDGGFLAKTALFCLAGGALAIAAKQIYVHNMYQVDSSEKITNLMGILQNNLNNWKHNTRLCQVHINLSRVETKVDEVKNQVHQVDQNVTLGNQASSERDLVIQQKLNNQELLASAMQAAQNQHGILLESIQKKQEDQGQDIQDIKKHLVLTKEMADKMVTDVSELGRKLGVLDEKMKQANEAAANHQNRYTQDSYKFGQKLDQMDKKLDANSIQGQAQIRLLERLTNQSCNNRQQIYNGGFGGGFNKYYNPLQGALIPVSVSAGNFTNDSTLEQID
jgi:hypothetical protein